MLVRYMREAEEPVVTGHKAFSCGLACYEHVGLFFGIGRR